MTNFKPLHDNVIIRPNAPPEKTPGGLFLAPTNTKDPAIEGVVIAVGPGRTLENGTRVRPEVETGVKVLCPQYGGTEVDIDGVKHRVMPESLILAILAP